MLARVEPVSGVGGEVDAADKGELAVYHDELLVMAVHWPLVRVERHPQLCTRRQSVGHRAHFLAVGVKERQRCARPCEQPHLDALCCPGEQLLQRLGVTAGQREIGREVPAGQRDRHACRLDRSRDLGQRVGTVDVHVESIALAWWPAGCSPAAGRGSQGRSLADPAQATRVMRDHQALDLLPESRIDPL